jgi:transcriptional regulator with GAF, ATPase, and Fis domain
VGSTGGNGSDDANAPKGEEHAGGSPEVQEPLMRLPPEGLSLRELERQLLIQALERTGGNQTRAAALLGLNRDQIRYRIDKYGLRDD